MMEGKFERLRDRLLICAVCMDEYKDPRILPCHHSLCYECIAKVFHSNSSRQGHFRCPHCRKNVCVPSGGIQELPINFYIVNLQDELGSREYEGECEICSGISLPSEYRCIECDKDICRFCIHSHRLEFHEQKPQVIRIQRQNVVPSHIVSSVMHCSSHQKERMQLFCITCNVPVCVTCSCGNHKRHHLIPLSEKLKDLQSLLKSEMSRIESDLKKLSDADSLMDELKTERLTLSNKSLLAIDAAASKACQSIFNKKSALEKEILDSERKQINAINTVQQKIKTLLLGLHSGYDYLTELQEYEMCLEAFESFKQFSAKLGTLRKDFSSIELELQDYQFSPSEWNKTADFSLGFVRNLVYYGRLGSLKSSHQDVVISPKTLIAKKVSFRISKLLFPYKTCFQKMLLFCFAFLFFLFISWKLGEIELTALISSYVKDAYQWGNATVQKQINFITEFVEQFFINEDSSLEEEPIEIFNNYDDL